MGNTQKTGYLQNLIQYDGSGNIVLPGTLTISTNKLVATQEYVGTQVAALVNSAPSTLDTLNELAAALGNDPNFATTVAASIGSKVPTTRTLTINGTAYDLSADRSWTIVGGVSSFNTRTGAITLTDTDVTGALGYTPVTNARTLTINGTTYDLSANRSWTIGATSSARNVQTITADGTTATYTVTNGYVVGLVDVYRNGVKLGAADITATNGTTVTLGVTPASGDIIEIVNYVTALTQNNALRTVNTFNVASATNTFTVSYTQGLLDVYYNGSKLTPAEYTATNGTSVVLSTNAAVGSVVEIITYNYSVSGFSGVGFSGTPTTNYIPKWTSSGVIGNSLVYDDGSTIGIGLSSLGAWDSTIRAMEIGTKGNFYGGFNGGASVVYIGTNAYYNGGWKYANTSAYKPQLLDAGGGNWHFQNAATGTAGNAITWTTLMKITDTGNVGIANTNPSYKLDIHNGSDFDIRLRDTSLGGTVGILFETANDFSGTSQAYIKGIGAGNSGVSQLIFGTAGASGDTTATERMRITSGGYTKMSNDGNYINATGPYHEMRTTSSNNEVVILRNTSASPYGYTLQFSGASPNGGSNWFMYCEDSTAQRFSVRSNGGVYNYSGNNVNLSDISTKKDIIPCESYWDKFKAIEIVKFKYIDQTHDDYNIGVIAQQVEQIAPEFIDVENWAKPDEEEKIMKAVYTEDLHHATIKVLQEAMAKIEELEAKVTALENINAQLINEIEILKAK